MTKRKRDKPLVSEQKAEAGRGRLREGPGTGRVRTGSSPHERGRSRHRPTRPRPPHTPLLSPARCHRQRPGTRSHGCLTRRHAPSPGSTDNEQTRDQPGKVAPKKRKTGEEMTQDGARGGGFSPATEPDRDAAGWSPRRGSAGSRTRSGTELPRRWCPRRHSDFLRFPRRKAGGRCPPRTSASWGRQHRPAPGAGAPPHVPRQRGRLTEAPLRPTREFLELTAGPVSAP